MQFNDVPVNRWCKERVGASDEEKKFLMGIVTADRNIMTCDCQDFPRIQFCKHIAAIHLHFPHLKQSDPIIM